VNEDLQFDRVASESSSAVHPDKVAATCAICRTAIVTEYFDINGSILCDRCRIVAESTAEIPRGIVPLAMAALYGLGAGILGAAVYYAVIAITHLEIGLVAILIGYMVGYAVHAGARGRGARRFQVLAVALTYGAIALAYAPMVFKQAGEIDRGAESAQAPSTTRSDETTAATDNAAAATSRPNAPRALLAVVMLGALVAALPVLVVFGSFPSGLISAFIMFIGMRQAWRMTAAPRLLVLGPYRVGAAPATTPA
jgi:hypothetical protein